MSPKGEKKREPSGSPAVTHDSTDEASFAGGTGDADKSVRAPVE